MDRHSSSNMNKNRLTIKIALSIVSILMASTVSASDQALLDILFKNGVLNQAQYEKLSRQSEEKEQEEITRTTSRVLQWQKPWIGPLVSRFPVICAYLL